MAENDQQASRLMSITGSEPQTVADSAKTEFVAMVDAVHARLRREARQSKKLVPFLDRDQLSIESSEYLRSALAL